MCHLSIQKQKYVTEWFTHNNTHNNTLNETYIVMYTSKIQT